MLKKIMIVIGIIIVWEQRDSIVPVSESVITYVIATGSSLLQSVEFVVCILVLFIKSVREW